MIDSCRQKTCYILALSAIIKYSPKYRYMCNLSTSLQSSHSPSSTTILTQQHPALNSCLKLIQALLSLSRQFLHNHLFFQIFFLKEPAGFNYVYRHSYKLYSESFIDFSLCLHIPTIKPNNTFHFCQSLAQVFACCNNIIHSNR